MKNIEEIIRNNRDFFEEEPSKGHLERFERKLEMRFHAGGAVKRSIVPYLLKAAVVTLLITLSSLWTWDHFLRPARSRMALGDISPEYKEVENYYIHQVNLMDSEIRTIDINNPDQQKMLKKEMRSMDSVYVQLQKDLKANPNDERIINAMIEHYQTKVDVMNYILNQLKAIRNGNQNTSENEKVSI